MLRRDALRNPQAPRILNGRSVPTTNDHWMIDEDGGLHQVFFTLAKKAPRIRNASNDVSLTLGYLTRVGAGPPKTERRKSCKRVRGLVALSKVPDW